MGFFFVKRIISTQKIIQLQCNFQRRMSSTKVGVILGAFQNSDKQLRLSREAEKFQNTNGAKNLIDQINVGGPLDAGSTRIFWNAIDKYPIIAVTGLGNADETIDPNEELDVKKETVRIGVSNAVRQLMGLKVDSILVDDMEDGQSAAEGAILGAHKFQEYKNQEKRTKIPQISLLENSNAKNAWDRGVILAEAQNLARILEETPANLMTPTIFCERIKAAAQGLNIQVDIHDEKWAADKKMGSFLSVTNGAKEPAKFLELTYNGGSNKEPICLVGKGVTFDTGGISIKPAAKMDEMRADMGGAANVTCSMLALAKLKVPLNIKVFVPLCENMPGGQATRPGDVFTAMNGKTICVDNTDAEGRLILADALCYACTFNPKYVVDVATLTGAIKVALGDCVSGVFTNNNDLWKAIHEAGIQTGDRVWRMPLFKHYLKQVSENEGYDLNNIGKAGIGGGSCTAAAFLREFVQKDTKWMHIDMAGVMGGCTDQSYSGKGMSGRPLRTLVEFVEREAGIKK